MNNLVRKLADQAIAHANQTWNPDSEPERFVLIAMEKHAELIVQECMNVLHDNELWNRHISHVLHEHFGVWS